MSTQESCRCKPKHVVKVAQDEVAVYYVCRRCGGEPLRLKPLRPGRST